MTKKEIMIKAHKMAKEIKAEYPGVDYKFQLGLCLAYLRFFIYLMYLLYYEIS